MGDKRSVVLIVGLKMVRAHATTVSNNCLEIVTRYFSEVTVAQIKKISVTLKKVKES